MTTVDFITKLLLVVEKEYNFDNIQLVVKNSIFCGNIKGISVEGLVRLFRDNVQKLHSLPESVISDREFQFAAELTKELNRMLRIKMKLSTAFHSQTDVQIEQIDQELKQYLRFFTKYKQRDWPKWLAIVEFAVNSKVYLATKILPFMANYGRELRTATIVNLNSLYSNIYFAVTQCQDR